MSSLSIYSYSKHISNQQNMVMVVTSPNEIKGTIDFQLEFFLWSFL